MNRELAYDEVFDAQSHFRLLLDSMARPGKINLLPAVALHQPEGIHYAMALVAFALLNVDTSFHCLLSQQDEVTRYLRLNTSSFPDEISRADFVLLRGDMPCKEIEAIKTGTLTYPEQGATLLIGVESLSEIPGDGALALSLKGPGVKGEKRLFVKGIAPELLAAVAERNAEFPIGLDLILCDAASQVAALPRSSRVSVL